jgi:hypothetical protein
MIGRWLPTPTAPDPDPHHTRGGYQDQKLLQQQQLLQNQPEPQSKLPS